MGKMVDPRMFLALEEDKNEQVYMGMGDQGVGLTEEVCILRDDRMKVGLGGMVVTKKKNSVGGELCGEYVGHPITRCGLGKGTNQGD